MTAPEATERRTVIRTSWGFFANSILAAALAVVFARLIEQLGVAIAGAFLGMEPVFTHVVTQLQGSGTEVAAIGGTVASLVGGISFLLLYPGAKDRSSGKLMVLWLTLFCFRNGFVDLAALALDDESRLAAALATFDLPAGIDIVLAATGGVGLLLIALAAAPAFLGFNRHWTEVATPQERLRYVATIALFPAIVGPLLAVPFFVPDLGTGYVASLPFIGAFIIITLLAAPGTKHILGPEVVEERGLSVGLVLILAITFLALRWMIGSGIPIPPWGENLEWRFRA